MIHIYIYIHISILSLSGMYILYTVYNTYYSTILGLTREINPFTSEVCGTFDFQS